MKRLLMIYTMISIFTHVHAQTENNTFYARTEVKGNPPENRDINKNINLHPVKVNEFDKVQVIADHKQIRFISLPKEKRPIWAYLTNIDGEIIREKKISRDKNYINARNVPAGTYFITLAYRCHNRKAVMIHL